MWGSTLTQQRCKLVYSTAPANWAYKRRRVGEKGTKVDGSMKERDRRGKVHEEKMTLREKKRHREKKRRKVK